MKVSIVRKNKQTNKKNQNTPTLPPKQQQQQQNSLEFGIGNKIKPQLYKLIVRSHFIMRIHYRIYQCKIGKEISGLSEIQNLC